jgi:hypothetical protein
MMQARFTISVSTLALAALCRCSLAFDLDGMDNGSAGTDAAVDAPPDAGTLALGLVAHYRFDETSGTSAADATGNQASATLLNGATFTAGRQNNAVSLGGTNDYVSLPANILSGRDSFSISVWVRPNATPDWSRVFDFGTGQTAYMFLTPNAPNTPADNTRFAITSAGYAGEQRLDAARLSSGAWHHVVVTLAGSTGRLYVNGNQADQTTSMTTSPADLGNTSRNWLGRSQYAADAYFNGQIDNFRIYNRALTAAEIQELESGGL